MPAKDLYRTYNIQSTSIGDDYAAIREVIARRFRGGSGAGLADSEGLPDVLVIDGGKGQLRAAVEALNLVGAPAAFLQRVCAIAKRHEEIFVVERGEPLDTDAHQPAVLLLRAARDEVRAREDPGVRGGVGGRVVLPVGAWCPCLDVFTVTAAPWGDNEKGGGDVCVGGGVSVPVSAHL